MRGSVTHLKLNNHWAVDSRLTPRSSQVHSHLLSLGTHPASAMSSFILSYLYTIEKVLSFPISGILNISVFSGCVCMHTLSHVWLLATLWIVTRQVPLSMGFSRQEYWNELPFSFPGDLSDPGIKPVSSVSPARAGEFFTSEPLGKAYVLHRQQYVAQNSTECHHPVIFLTRIYLDL